MLMKKDIIRIMKEFPYSKEHYSIGFKGALVLYGLYEDTKDLDIFVDYEVREDLIRKGYPRKVAPLGGLQFMFTEDIDLFPQELASYTKEIEGIRVESLESIISWYDIRGREKGQEKIERIREFIRKGE